MDLFIKFRHNQFQNLIENELVDKHFSKYFTNTHLAKHLLLAVSVSLFSYLTKNYQ